METETEVDSSGRLLEEIPTATASGPLPLGNPLQSQLAQNSQGPDEKSYGQDKQPRPGFYSSKNDYERAPREMKINRMVRRKVLPLRRCSRPSVSAVEVANF